MLGGHPIKLGLSRYIIDLIERGLITHVATNGAGIIHDFELALVGGTSEDVSRWISSPLKKSLDSPVTILAATLILTDFPHSTPRKTLA